MYYFVLKKQSKKAVVCDIINHYHPSMQGKTYDTTTTTTKKTRTTKTRTTLYEQEKRNELQTKIDG